jgi:predicted AlkP superfamily phosphohydrolase/phosphomutase
MAKGSRVLLIGLDCAPPELIFNKWKKDLPNISNLIDNGIYGKLKSIIPPITIPAWTSMFSSKDPGQLGFYGFRNRRSYNYEELYFANANYVKEKLLWNYLSINRKTSIVINVPQTFPPKPLRGIMVGCFLTPNKEVQFTYPNEIKYEIDNIADGNYIIDVENFRTEEKERLLKQIYEMTERRFKVIKNFLKTKYWDIFIFVEMGIDRIHHGFWRYMDKHHRLYEENNPYKHAIKRYYEYIDSEIGEVIDIIPDKTYIIIVSDHGAKGMKGGICINEWLKKEGYLKLRENPEGQVPLKTSMIDWGNTYAWGEGGYYGRLFLNVKGREPQGIIDRDNYEKFRDEIKYKLENLGDDKGNNIGTIVFKPEEIYRECKNIPPDLIIYFGNLNWRSAGSIGLDEIHMFENDTGPDDANHDQYGIFVMSRKGEILENKGERENLNIYDVAPTILSLFDSEIPEDMIGKIVR